MAIFLTGQNIPDTLIYNFNLFLTIELFDTLIILFSLFLNFFFYTKSFQLNFSISALFIFYKRNKIFL